MKPRQPFRVSGNGANSIRLQQRPGRCGRSFSLSEPSPQPGGGFFIWRQRSSDARSAGREYSARGAVRMRAVLRPARGRLRATITGDLGALRRRDPGRPQRHLALRRLPAARGGPPGPPIRSRRCPACPPARRRWCAPTGSRSISACARCGSRTTPPTRPTRSRTASSLSPRRGRASSASTLSRAPRPATSATPWPPRRRRWGCPPTSSSPRDLEEQKILATGVYGANVVAVAATTTTSTGSARSSRPSTRLGVREHQHAAVLRRGLEDARLRDRRAARLELPDRFVVPIASGSLFTKIARGFDEWIEIGLVEGARAGDERRPGERLLAGRDGVRRRRRHLPAGQARHDREVAGDRQPGRWPIRARPRPPQRWR